MGRPRGWAAAAAGRPPMRSPGRPPAARREHRQRFWAAIGRGLPSEDAAVEAGVSQPVGTRWFREAGGMPSITRAPVSGRFRIDLEVDRDTRYDHPCCFGRPVGVCFFHAGGAVNRR